MNRVSNTRRAKTGVFAGGSDNEWSVNYADSVVNVIQACAPSAASPEIELQSPQCNTHLSPLLIENVSRVQTEPHLVCVVCGKPLTKRWQKRCCSTSCAGRLTPIRSQAGADNGNFRGWRSRNRTNYARTFRERNPEKVRAQRIAAEAIRKGELVRPTYCASCLRDCHPDAHHPNYALPLSVEWLCKRCHRAADLIAVRLRKGKKAVGGCLTVGG